MIIYLSYLVSYGLQFMLITFKTLFLCKLFINFSCLLSFDLLYCGQLVIFITKYYWF